MKDLLVFTKQEDQEVIDAQYLYTLSESKQRFTDWIKDMIEKLSLKEGEDYVRWQADSTGGRPGDGYSLSHTAALSVASRCKNFKVHEFSKQLREYIKNLCDPKFIVERALQTGKVVLKETLQGILDIGVGMAITPFPGSLENGVPRNVRRLNTSNGGRIYILTYDGKLKQRVVVVYDPNGKFLRVGLGTVSKHGVFSNDIIDTIMKKYKEILGEKIVSRKEDVGFDDYFRWKTSIMVKQPTLENKQNVWKEIEELALSVLKLQKEAEKYDRIEY